MDQSELLRHLCSHLSRTGIRYFITDSQATIVYGERHLRDIQGILRVRGAKLDRGYIDQHVGELLVMELWQQVQQAEPPGR